ncbi:hypothetical protein AMAG_00230 [Allomyces macrogynus ATCC 38327]|uniref:Uncharacterized protein n=1 Tax=Allomyces macrogynus (strain ATCC 38327) TaxID=578462 RepID=A0A0L0RVX4_ALLM3|nr:hypothetical protein AMAG_00230 [Allomyces macrogynus ATCC 38327]|eukprot:KNE54240.1 hypothetical protein AMAG_00230 [Allomyces macrogynus ATCC 38327]
MHTIFGKGMMAADMESDSISDYKLYLDPNYLMSIEVSLHNNMDLPSMEYDSSMCGIDKLDLAMPKEVEDLKHTEHKLFVKTKDLKPKGCKSMSSINNAQLTTFVATLKKGMHLAKVGKCKIKDLHCQYLCKIAAFPAAKSLVFMLMNLLEAYSMVKSDVSLTKHLAIDFAKDMLSHHYIGRLALFLLLVVHVTVPKFVDHAGVFASVLNLIDQMGVEQFASCLLTEYCTLTM